MVKSIILGASDPKLYNVELISSRHLISRTSLPNDIIDRSSHRRCSVKSWIFLNFAKFTETPMPGFLFLIKLQASAYNFIKTKTLTQLLFCEFWEIFQNTCFLEHLHATASVLILPLVYLHL